MEVSGAQALITARLQPFVDSGALRGVGVGVVVGGERTVTSLGCVNPGAVYEIGSITKVMTALLLADMCLRGEVDLHEEVRMLLPAGMKVPSADGRHITLAHLAMHTAGLPRLPPGLLEPDEAPEDPYARFGTRELYRSLAITDIGTVGRFSSYSNFGYGLLGHALALRAGKSLDRLLVERVLEPLGMSDSGIQFAPRVRKKLVTGYDSGGWEVPHWHFKAMAACAAAHSTVEDLLELATAVLNPQASPLQRQVQLTIDPGVDVPVGPGTRRGLGWVILTSADRRVIWHNGGTAGFASYLAAVPEAGIALVLLGNSAWEDLTITGERLLAALVEQA